MRALLFVFGLLAAFGSAAQELVAGRLDSVGDPRMAPLMDAWMAGARRAHPGLERGRWDHRADAKAIGALMFETADVAPLAREPQPAEIAPYAHQFHGDMMKAPLLVRVATLDGAPAYVAVNKRPDAPLPPKVVAFLDYALSSDGQRAVAATATFTALTPEQAAAEHRKLEGRLVPLDPALPVYDAKRERVRGAIRSVGSDGMKSLMDRWMRDFHRLQPGVAPGGRWEHLGTLNGLHALLADETDIAPMGRELWASEVAAWRATHASAAPLEIRVARGGFDTQQRTTAQAVFVNARNPITRVTLAQLRDIFGEPRRITTWGQLGLAGEWAERRIAIRVPPRVAPNATSMQVMMLAGGAWAADAREAPVADTAAAIANDEGAIGFGGFEDRGPGLKTLAVARDASGPFIEGTAETAATGRYPLTRYMYIRLAREAGKGIDPAVREFLRYILSRDGQEPIRYSGYFPLTAAEAKEELAKLD